MGTNQSRSLPAIDDALVDGNKAAQQRWIDDAAATLSLDALLTLEARVYQNIDRRYPEDPADLFNRRQREGKKRKKAWRATFDGAYDRYFTDDLARIETTRARLLNHHQVSLANALYAERRIPTLQRRSDQMTDQIQARLAADGELQRQLVLERAATSRSMQLAQHAHDLDTHRLRVVAELDRARRRLEQPFELLMTLYDLVKSLAQFRMSLEDRAQRNPALEDRLQMMALGLTRVMSAVNGLISELTALGAHPPTPEQLREQSEQVLAMAMEQMQQWQHQTQQEANP